MNSALFFKNPNLLPNLLMKHAASMDAAPKLTEDISGILWPNLENKSNKRILLIIN